MSGPPLIVREASDNVMATVRTLPAGWKVTSPCTNSGQGPVGMGMSGGPPPSLGGGGRPLSPLLPALPPSFGSLPPLPALDPPVPELPPTPAAPPAPTPLVAAPPLPV